MRKNFFKKKLASTLALAMVVTSLVTPTSASAATTTKVVKQGGKAAPTVLYVGDKGTDYGLSRTFKGNKYTWTISNSAIATINKAGVVTAKAPGTVTIKATARNSKGKWLAAFTHKVKINLRATSVDIGADDFTLVMGQEKDLNAVKTPAKSTDALKYLSDNTEVATVDAKTGVVKTVGVGEATITVLSKATASSADTSKYNKKDTVKVTVVDGIQAVKQTTPSKLEVTFATDQKEKLTKDNLVINDSNGVKQIIKELSFSDDGKVATVTLYIDLVDKATYKVAYANTEKTFTASVGEVASIVLSGKTVQYGEPTSLDVKLLDAAGVDVTTDDTLVNDVTFDVDAGKAYVDYDSESKKHQITVYNYPESVTVKATYHTYDYTDTTEKVFVSSAVVNSVKELPTVAKDIVYTVASESADWNKISTTIPADSNYKLFLKAKNADSDKDLTQEDFTFESGDLSMLTLSQNGENVYLYPVKPGTVYIKATYGSTVKMLPITIGTEAKVTSVTLDKSSANLSDALAGGDSATLTFTAKNQYGNEVDYDNEDPVSFERTGTDKVAAAGGVIIPSADNNKITFSIDGDVDVTRTATNTYKLTYLDRVYNVSITVTNVTNTDVSSIKIEQSTDSVDVVVKPDTDAAKNVVLTVYGYNSAGQKVSRIENAEVTIKLGNDVKLATTTAVDGVATFAALDYSDDSRVVTQAATGTYTVIAKDNGRGTASTNKQMNASFKITNTQVKPTVKLDKGVVDRYSTLYNALTDAIKVTTDHSYVIQDVEARYDGRNLDRDNFDDSLEYTGSMSIKSITIRETIGDKELDTKISVGYGLSIK